MVSFSQASWLQTLVGLMGLETRAGLVAENKLGLWCSSSPTHPGSPSPGSQAEQHPGESGIAMGLLWSEWSVQWRQRLSCHCDCAVLCARARQSWCQVRPGHCHGDRMGPQTAHINSHLLPQLSSDRGLWLLASPWAGRGVKHQPPCSRSAETPSSGVTHLASTAMQVIHSCKGGPLQGCG